MDVRRLRQPINMEKVFSTHSRPAENSHIAIKRTIFRGTFNARDDLKPERHRGYFARLPADAAASLRA